MITNLFARLAVGKVAVATAVTMTAVGGAAALAANSHSGTHPDHGLAIAAQHSPSASDSSETDAPESDAPTSEAASDTGRPSAVPSPSLTGLCHAFQAGAGSHQPKVLQNPAFSVLVNTAGGVDAVAGFCAELIGPAPTHPAGRPSVVPSHSHPAGAPSAVPSHSHPAGAPSVILSHSHPAGAPSVIPSHSHPAP